MNDIALYGTVRTKEEQSAWLEGLIAEAIHYGEITEDKAEEMRQTLLTESVHAIPMRIAVDSKAADAPLTPAHLLPKDWNGQFTEHKWEVDPQKERALPFTHVVLLAGPTKPSDFPFYFDGKKISGPFAVCLYDAAKTEYKYIHCESCAVTITQWLASEQRAWMRATLDEPMFAKATHVAPQRLQ